MGKTPRPKVLCITDPVLRAAPEVQALAAKGHTIVAWGMDMILADSDGRSMGLLLPDLILGPNCRMVTADTIKYVALALKELGKASKPVLATQTMELPMEVAEEDDDELSI